MPRNGSGTYTLPTGNPVVAGTTIEASWANNTLADVATELTGSLSRSGAGGMTGPLRLDAGTSGVPGLAWGAETTTGFYRAGTNDMRLAVATADVQQWTASGTAVTGTLSASGAATLSSTLAVTGATTLTGAVTLNGGIANNPTLTAGTANGILYLDGSKVATSGSGLVFDGTNLGIGTASPNARLVVQQANNTADGIRLFASGSDTQLITRYVAGVDAWQVTASFSSTGAYKPITWWTSDLERMRLDASGNLGLNTSTFGTSAAGVLALGTGTAPTTGPADTVQLFSVDRSAGNTIPAIRCEGSGVTNAGITNTTVTNKIAVQVNGTIYYLLATTNAT